MKKLLLTVCSALTISTFSMAQTPVKKVILEDFTGAWCGWCPEGTVILENLAATNPTTFFPVASHNGDVLQVTCGAAIDNALSVTSYPNGAVDRFLFSGNTTISQSRGKWSNMVASRLATSSIVSVGYSNQYYDANTDSFFTNVNVKFVTAPTANVPLTMNIYFLEDSIPATVGTTYEQHNYSTSIQGGASILTNWWYNHTLRGSVNGNWGYTNWLPTTPVIDSIYTIKVGFSLNSSWIKKNVHLLAYVAYNGSASANTLEILNSEKISLENFYPLGVAETKKAINLMQVSPNPIAKNASFNFTYSLQNSSSISIHIYDVMGRIVAQPYQNIYDVKGIHTLTINPTNLNLNSGIYMLQIVDNQGQKAIQKIIIE
ncbi:MAG: hypothetical protein RIQ33_1686 [Bacteroidota bacterium]|jgi:hypothetical protein